MYFVGHGQARGDGYDAEHAEIKVFGGQIQAAWVPCMFGPCWYGRENSLELGGFINPAHSEGAAGSPWMLVVGLHICS